MAKTKKKAVLLVVCLMLAVLCAGVLAACNGSETYTVTFMVRENGTTGDWQQYTTVDTNDDGSVTLPAEPTVDGYTFRDWYTDEACSADNVFDETSVSGDITVYALMAEANITLNITDGSGTSTQIAGTLSALSQTTAEQEAAAAAANLTFDGWYTDAAFTQKYSDGMDATALYGRYMAKIIYDNGYETLYSELVTPGTLTSAPDARVDDFVKRYMDDEDISYNDSEGNAIDFTSDTFVENEVVTVLWKTPGLVYASIEGQENKYYVSNIVNGDYLTYPVISFLSNDVHGVNSGGEAINGDVVGVVFDGFGTVLDHTESLTKIIFADGIEYISGLQMSNNKSLVEEISLPGTLKVLERSVWGFGSLKDLLLPQGLEVIIDCFWGDYSEGISVDYREAGYDFNIIIPSTVTNMVAVPGNLDLSQNDHFEYDDGRLYHVDGDSKILCSEYQSNVTDEGRLVVEEGVTGVQVYLLSNMDFDYLDLPSTFREVGYNNAAEDYTAYTGNRLTPRAVINNPDVTPASETESYSYAIVSNLDEITYVTIARTGDLPVSDYAFVSTSGVPYNGSEFEDDVKVVFIGDVATGEVVEVRLTVSFVRDNEVSTQKLTGYKSGDSLTVAEILEKANVSESRYNVIVSNIGKEYKGGTITSNMYITVECYAKVGGFTYTVNADGETATVTGFNSATAEQLTDGTYRVNIDMIDGYVVTAIADGAFKGEKGTGISEVYIANTVTTIGAESFMNMSNLRLVDIAPGGLSVIGESAFENAGCVQDSDGNWAVNTEGGVDELTMILPLADLTDIQPYAFKTLAIETFTPVAGEESRYVLLGLQGAMAGEYVADDLKTGEFYWAMGASNMYLEIVQYVKQGTEKASDGSDVTVIDVRLIAIAGGDPTAGYPLAIGSSYRAAAFATMMPLLKTAVLRFEVMEGSVYFVNYAIEFGIVSKVHTNAFTDMRYTSTGEQKYNTIYWYGPEGDTWLSQEDLQSQSSAIFEEGWWEGVPNSQNKITSDAEMDKNTILGQ